jgi:hypothetical protein
MREIPKSTILQINPTWGISIDRLCFEKEFGNKLKSLQRRLQSLILPSQMIENRDLEMLITGSQITNAQNSRTQFSDYRRQNAFLNSRFGLAFHSLDGDAEK